MILETRLRFLQTLRSLAYRDAEHLDTWTTFLPLSVHRRALHPDCVVVLGNRGSGKTALFTLVRGTNNCERLRAFFEDTQIPDAAWIDAFSQTGLEHPEVSVLERQGARLSDTTLRIFWLAHLLRRIHRTQPDLLTLPAELSAMMAIPVADVDAWLPLASAHAGMLAAALDDIERALADRGQLFVAAYDTLDRIAQFDRETRRRYVSTLLALWLSLASRYRQIRGKIFLRDDLFEASELGFPDATKLRPRSVSLDWGHGELFRLLVRHLAVEPEAREWLHTVRDLSLRDRGEFGWLPGDMPERVQQALAAKLAGAAVGRGVLKTPTARWILGRLEDAHARITPRSLLWFFGFAAESALKNPQSRSSRPLASSNLLPALRKTSVERVGELCEEYTLVGRVENLRAMQLPLERKTLDERLSVPRPGESPPLPVDGEAILREMERLGVIKLRADGKFDLPDIYRYAFDITPNYGEAWHQYIQSAAPEASAQLSRELPELSEILAAAPWSTVGDSEDPKVALAECERALELAASFGNELSKAEVHCRMGVLLLLQKQWEPACEYLLQAEVVFSNKGDREQLGQVLVHLLTAAVNMQRQDVIEHVAQRLSEDPVLAAICSLYVGVMQAERDQADGPLLLLKGLERLPSTSEFLVFRGLAFVSLSGVVERSHDIETALLLMGVASRIGEIVDLMYQSASASSADQETLLSVMAERVGISGERVADIQRQADDAWARDQGWSILRRTFPDVAASKR